MDAVSNVSRSIEAVNQVLKTAQAESTDMAKKMVKVQHEMALAANPFKGNAVDLQA